MKRFLLVIAAAAFVAAPSAVAAHPTIDARVDQAHPRFGDSFRYVVTATVDASIVNGARLASDVAPFTRIRPTVEKRSTANGVGHVTVTQTIACLSAACLEKRGGVIALPRARVSAGGEVATAPVVPVTVESRVGAVAVKAPDPSFRRPRALPGPTYRISPGIAAALLALVGVGLLAGAAVLAAPLLRSRVDRLRVVDADQRRRAVRLLRESAARGADDRRRAASLAARVVGEPELARTAAGIAWARPEPGPPDATTLADRVEQAAGGRA